MTLTQCLTFSEKELLPADLTEKTQEALGKLVSAVLATVAGLGYTLPHTRARLRPTPTGQGRGRQLAQAAASEDVQGCGQPLACSTTPLAALVLRRGAP